MYDVKFFQRLVLEGAPVTLSIGYNIKTVNDTRGYYTELQNTGSNDLNWTNDSDILVVDYTKNFRKGQIVTSSVDTTFKKTIDKVHTYDWSNITNIRGKSGSFYAKVKMNAKIQNGNSQLFGKVPGIVRTARDDSKVFDNDFEILMPNPPVISSTGGTIAITPSLSDTFFSTATANGDYKRTRIDDGNEITKKLKYAYLKVRNGAGRSTDINYGWTTNDREITLVYSDIHKVQGLSQGTVNNEFSHFDQIDINIAGGGIIPQGSLIIGSTSRTVAVVALSNTDVNEIELTNTSGYHTSRSGTGSPTVLEIIKRDDTKTFVLNEQLLIITPNDKDAFNNVVTFFGNRSTIITNSTEEYGSRVELQYFVDDGQRDHTYEIGKIIRKPLLSSPSEGDLTIFFSYYEDQDSTNKFYYNADSYANSGYSKSNPTYFKNATPIRGNNINNGINRKNLIDFRKKLQAHTNTSQNSFLFNHQVYNNRASILPGIGNNFNSRSNFTLTFEEYLSRYDILYINSGANKQLCRLGGLPARDPEVPKFDNNIGMKLATIKVPGAFKSFDRLFSVIENNKNFTMKEISTIEKRLKNLENVISLSFLETQALAEDVNDRTKLGFIVDDFTSKADDVVQNMIKSTAFASRKDKTLRPKSVSTTVDMEISDTTENGLKNKGIDPYYFSKGFITKTYTQFPNVDNKDNEYVSQLQASNSLRVNPHSTSVYTGYMTLDPPRDTTRVKANRNIKRFIIDREGLENDSDVSLQEFELNVKPVPMSDTWAGEWENLGGVTTTTSTKGNVTVTVSAQSQIKNTFQKKLITRDKAEDFDREDTFIDVNAFVHSREIIFDVEGLKPNTVHSVFFNQRNVTNNCIQADDTSGTPTFLNSTNGVLKTDGLGLLRGKFTIPPATFKTGIHILTIKNNNGLSIAKAKYIAGSTYDVGILSKFRTEGIEDIIVDTEARIKTFNKIVKYRGNTVSTDSGDQIWGEDTPGVSQISDYMDDIHASNMTCDPFEPASNGTIDYSDFSVANSYTGMDGIDGHVSAVASDLSGSYVDDTATSLNGQYAAAYSNDVQASGNNSGNDDGGHDGTDGGYGGPDNSCDHGGT